MLAEESDVGENALPYRVTFSSSPAETDDHEAVRFFSFLFVGSAVARARAAVWLEFYGECLPFVGPRWSARSVTDKDLSAIPSHPVWDRYVWVLCKVLGGPIIKFGIECAIGGDLDQPPRFARGGRPKIGMAWPSIFDQSLLTSSSTH